MTRALLAGGLALACGLAGFLLGYLTFAPAPTPRPFVGEIAPAVTAPARCAPGHPCLVITK